MELYWRLSAGPARGIVSLFEKTRPHRALIRAFVIIHRPFELFPEPRCYVEAWRNMTPATAWPPATAWLKLAELVSLEQGMRIAETYVLVQGSFAFASILNDDTTNHAASECLPFGVSGADMQLAIDAKKAMQRRALNQTRSHS